MTWNVKERKEYRYKTGGNFRYEVKDGKVYIVKYLGSDTEVTVPSKIDGYPVFAIGMGAFSNQTQITAIHLPNTLNTIESWAFNNCVSLKELVIPEKVKNIRSYAIWCCEGLEILYLPHVTTMEKQAVSYCENLQTVYCASYSKPANWNKNWLTVSCEPNIVWGTAYTDPQPDDPNENDPNVDVSDGTPTENSRKESAEESAEESEGTISVPVTSEEESVSAGGTESSSPRTISEEDAEEGSFPWGWIAAAVLIAGAGVAIFLVRRKK